MKFSRFNVWSLGDQGLVLFNTLTCALALFENVNAKKMLDALEKRTIKEIPEEFLEAMIEDGYLVDDDRNELDAIKNACAERQSRIDECSLCVILTMACNFKCFYCFEENRNEQLSEIEANKVRLMFRKLCSSAKKIEVDWFGGEPLLSFKLLQIMNNVFMMTARQSGVEYQHSITTNGYLLTKETIAYLTNTPLSVLTITLDGPPDTHDASRPLRGGGQTFWTIFGNIKNAVAAGLKVSIRVNITTRNMNRVFELYHILEEHGLKNKVEVNLQVVVSSSTNPCEASCLSTKNFARKVMSIYKKAAENGWIVLPPTEKMKALGFCVGEYPNRFITDLYGNLYRCGQMFETDSVGTLENDGSLKIDSTKNNIWVKKDPLQFPECRECSVLPICMGGCNMKRYSKQVSDYCLDWKHDLPGFLEVLILNEKNIKLVESNAG